ncbi:MAG: histidine kinase N-terminal 7TM domain-containing protein [Bacteroidota bacterium]|nr:histidine kinase N-terminal 7TM domain-containing protein [Bacteroidota bacterium]
MDFTIYSYIYLATSIITLSVAVMAWQRKRVVGSKELAGMTLAVSLCSFFLIFESASETVSGKVFWSKVSYLFVVLIPIFYYLFVFRFTKLIRFKDLKGGWMLFLLPFITLIMAWTNDYHHLIWSGFSPISEKTNLIVYYHGFWFLIGYMLYSYILIFFSTIRLLSFNRKNKHKKAFRHQGWVVVLAGLIPWAASILYLTGLDPVPGLDITTISTMICSLLFAYSILRSQLLNLVPIARETLVETLPIGIIALDDQNRIQDINESAKVLLGITMKDLFGLTPFQAASTATELLDAVLSEETPAQVDLTENGCFRSFQIVKKNLKSLNGSRLIIINDITEQIIRQKELMEAKLKAEESDNLKSAFLANMSHEIRTPMNSIMGFISILQESDLSSEEREEYLGIVKSNGDRLLSTLNDIVDLSKIESGQIHLNLTEMDVNEILINMYGLFKNEAEIKGLVFSRSDLMPNDVSYIRTDKDKLYSIITNLIKNALKYTNEGFVRFECVMDETHLIFSVSDSGIGIPKEKHKAVFERFIQVDSSRKRVYEGSGLGLAITKAYVEMLGGKIWLESEEGKGSTFSFNIPIEHVPFNF